MNDIELMRANPHQFSTQEKDFIHNAFVATFHYDFQNSSCQDCYSDAMVRIYRYLKINDLLEMGKYTLKAGVVLQMAGDPNVYTNINLTDEIAVKYLVDNTNRIDFFSAYPPNWHDEVKSVIAGKPIQKTADTTQETELDLQSDDSFKKKYEKKLSEPKEI